MIPSRIEIPFNGQSFFVDIADGNMVNLNSIYEISGAPETQSPRRWTSLPDTKKLLNSINDKKSVILKTKRGKGGGTWAHWQLALSYAQYLSPELHLAVNQVFRERLEETIDPELGIKRSRERAVKNWKKQGHDDEWIADRSRHIDTRKAYVDTLLDHEVKPGYEIGVCTNKIYTGIFRKDKAEIEQEIRKNRPNLPAKINIRDFAKRSSIAAIGLAEALASEEIEEFDVNGVTDCAKVSFDKATSVRLALDSARSKAPKTLEATNHDTEKNKQRIQSMRNALKGR